MENMTLRSSLAYVALFLLGSELTFSGIRKGECRDSSTPRGTKGSVSCYDEHGKPVGSKSLQSATLRSPDGRLGAYVVAKATFDRQAAKNPETKHECWNTSQVFVNQAGSTSPRMVFAFGSRNEPSELGNGIELADWSKDGRYLAAALHKWAYFSDWFHFDLLVYDSKSKQMLQPNVEEMFSKRTGKQCAIELRAIGFDVDGVTPVIGAWDNPEEEACLEERGIWHVDLSTNTVTPLPKDFKAPRFGTVSE
jgi:hypothetical protein